MVNKIEPSLPKPEWGKRRRLLYAALAFIATWLSWMFYKGTDSGLFQNASIALIGGGVALIGQYIFGAAWDDKNYMDAAHKFETTRKDDDDSDTPPRRPRFRSNLDKLKDAPKSTDDDDEDPPINGGNK